MKLLIAAHGTQPESLLAKVTDTPVYYLVVDMTTSAVNVLNLTGQPDLQIVAAALAQGAGVLITGSGDSRTSIKTLAGLTTVSLSGGRTVEDAIHCWKNGVLNPNEDPPSEVCQASTRGRSLRNERAHAQNIFRGTCYSGKNPTPRGRHHLQQYAGRGH